MRNNAATAEPEVEPGPAPADFEAIDRALAADGPAAALDRLAHDLADRGEFRALLDALLLRARHDLGLPLIQLGALPDLPEPRRSQYEERYLAAIRDVGGRLLQRGEIAAAWPYFRAIAEPGPVAEAIDRYQPAPDDERLGQIIEIAFNGGANPRRGFALILEHYGACSAITAFEGLPPDEALRAGCAASLTAHLHEQLVASLRADIARRGQPLPPEGTPIAGLLEGRDWLFDDDAYHLDVSHLSSVVRMSPLLTEPESIARAVELTDYGRRLSPRYRYEGEPPFEDVYEDHAAYLRAELGEEVDAGLARLRSKLTPTDPDGDGDTRPAQFLVRLLVRLGRLDEAIDAAAEHLRGVPEGSLFCPGLPQLCARAGRLDRLADESRRGGDLVHYAAARLSPPTS